MYGGDTALYQITSTGLLFLKNYFMLTMQQHPQITVAE